MYFAIITAGGTGQRMGSASPKQFIKIGAKPIIVHTIQKFLDYSSDLEIIITLPEIYFKDWNLIKNKFLPSSKLTLIEGGETRFSSIRNALGSIGAREGLVAIHDAVRPFVTTKIIKATFEEASKTGSGVASIGLNDSIRELQSGNSIARDRSKFRLMQTPQTFDLNKIRKAYSVTEKQSFTDDASVWENFGYEVRLVEGSRSNIKITYPEDLLFAESILKA